MSSQRRQFLPVPSTSGREEPTVSAGQGTHVPADGSLHFGVWSYWREKESSGDGSVCHPVLGYPFQPKARGPPPLSRSETPRCFIQRDFPLLGQDAKDSNPARSVEVQVEWENSLGATTRNDHPTLQDSSCPFPKGLAHPFSQQDDRLKADQRVSGWGWGFFFSVIAGVFSLFCCRSEHPPPPTLPPSAC